MLVTELRLHRGHVVAGQPDQRLFALLQVRPETLPKPAARAPLAVAFVIDGSGSMAPHAALVTTALRHVLDSGLLEPTDQVGLVRFASHATTLLPLTPWAQRASVLRAFGQLDRCDGSTALGAGLDLAADMLADAPGSRRVVLLSDGATHDTALALAAADRLGEGATPVAAIGVGDDWNESLLLAITNRTGGLPAHVVPDGRKPVPPSVPVSRLPTVLAGELRHAANTVIADLRLVLDLAPGVSLARVTRVFPSVRDITDGALGTIEAGVTTSFVLELVLPAAPEGPLPVARLALDFRAVDDSNGRLGPLELRVGATAAAGIAGATDPTVMRAVQQRNLDGLVQQAAEAARSDPAQARQLLELARDLTLRLGNDPMTLAVDNALRDLAKDRTLSAASVKRLVVGGKTQTVSLAGLEGLPPEDLIRRIAGV